MLFYTSVAAINIVTVHDTASDISEDDDDNDDSDDDHYIPVIKIESPTVRHPTNLCVCGESSTV